MSELFNEVKETTSFSGVRVYLAGKSATNKNEIVSKLESVGAVLRGEDNKSGSLLGLAKETCVIIIGDKDKKLSSNDLDKMALLAYDGYHIPSITEEEMYLILSGEKDVKFPQPTKCVDITYDSLFNSRFSPIVHLNFYEYSHPLLQKEIYLHDIKGDGHLLSMCLGYVGAFANNDFDPQTTDFCWLKKETIDKLRKGEKDDFIRMITDGYNSSSKTKFTLKFLIESEVVYWLEYRAREVGDMTSLEYITQYKKSLYEG